MMSNWSVAQEQRVSIVCSDHASRPVRLVVLQYYHGSAPGRVGEKTSSKVQSGEDEVCICLFEFLLCLGAGELDPMFAGIYTRG